MHERFFKIQLTSINNSYLKFNHVSALSKNYKPINHFKKMFKIFLRCDMVFFEVQLDICKSHEGNYTLENVRGE